MIESPAHILPFAAESYGDKVALITGGAQLSFAELERVIAGHPDVAMVAVGSIPDEDKGELAKAYVIAKEGTSPEASKIIDYCREHLAAYKVPRALQFFAGGYFHSGDLAVCRPDGYIEIKDRSKDVIISGGENISSIEIEAVLYRHPAVLEAAVAAMPDDKWGETPCAFVELRADAADVNEQEIIDFCRDNMAHFKAPRRVVFGPLPKTSTGKIQKFVLRQRVREI